MSPDSSTQKPVPESSRGQGSTRRARPRRRAVLSPADLARVAVLVILLLAAAGAIIGLGIGPEVPSWGWDESMHAELPAARMAVSLGEGQVGGAADALLDCQQYPFVYPLYLAGMQLVFGVGEEVARRTTLWLWILAAVLGGAALGREVLKALAPRYAFGPAFLLWLPLLALASPLAGNFARTLFLEIPFAAVSFLTLRAWLRRGDTERRERVSIQLAAGAWVMLAFFTKFNYGLLLGAALVLDWLIETLIEWRAGRIRAQLRRGLWLALVPALSAVWWFLLPLPAGLARGAEHRAAFLGFLQGNQAGNGMNWRVRLLHWGGELCHSPATLVLLALGVLLSLRLLALRPVRTLWLVLLVMALPIAMHPFHLDRFLIPAAPALWMLAGIGWHALSASAFLRRLPAPVPFAAAGLLFLVGAFLPYSVDDFADDLSLASADEGVRAYQRTVFDGWGWGGRVATAGLPRKEARDLLAEVADELQSGERFGWLGLSTELSPAALHLGVLERSQDRTRFLRDAQRPVDVVPVAGLAPPPWDLETLGRWALGYDVLFMTDPPELKGREPRAELRERFHVPLVRDLGWRVERIGLFELQRVNGGPVEVSLYACRPPQ